MDFRLPDGTVFGRYLGREWRDSRGLSRADCTLVDGGRTDRHRKSEEGEALPPTRTIWARAQMWGCSPSDLWRWDDHCEAGRCPVSRRKRIGFPRHGETVETASGDNRIRVLREAQAMSGAELAEALGCSRQMIHQWETGQREPQLDTIWRLAQALGVPTGHLWRWR